MFLATSSLQALVVTKIPDGLPSSSPDVAMTNFGAVIINSIILVAPYDKYSILAPKPYSNYSGTYIRSLPKAEEGSRSIVNQGSLAGQSA